MKLWQKKPRFRIDVKLVATATGGRIFEAHVLDTLRGSVWLVDGESEGVAILRAYSYIEDLKRREDPNSVKTIWRD